MKYILGLDIGIGSVGWAVVRDEDEGRIEKCGVEIFDSGELPKDKMRKSQKRRAYRGARRLIRRRSFRKNRLKIYFEQNKIVSQNSLKEYFENPHDDVLKLRVKGLDSKLTGEELTACLINICNHRGYRDFYAQDDEELEQDYLEQLDDDEKSELDAVNNVKALLEKGKYRSIAELYLKDEKFNNEGSEYRKYRNRDGYEEKFVAPREILEKEANDILREQSKYNSCLTEQVINTTKAIIFATRDFEDGPGKAGDEYRKYKGFIDTIGKCMYYKDEERASRYTYIADIFALVNSLSQYKFVDKKTGEIGLTKELAKMLLKKAVENTGLTKTELKKFLAEHNFEVVLSEKDDREPINKAIKYLKAIKPILEGENYNFNELINEDYFDLDHCFLNKVGKLLSNYITPKRRIAELNKIEELNGKTSLIKKISKLKVSGTSKVSYKYMQGAIEAFLNGELYGEYQAKMNENISQKEENEKYSKLPPFTKDFEFYKNPVVLRSINETRKIINHIVELYGSPYAINIEVESDLNRTFEERADIEKEQKKNEAIKIKARGEIAQLLSISEAEVTESMIERYRLGEQQNWHCIYSDKTIDKNVAILNSDKVFEVDHIIPFSLILDNTLNNKVLVYADENQLKRQRTPLEYLGEERGKVFRGIVNKMYKEKKISDKKYKYLLTPCIKDSEELFDEWKSRNINDTRYIAKFLVGYLKNNLQFASRKEGEKYRQQVYAIKGAVTSQMRRLWLDKNTWGMYDKSKLKEVTYLDHVADAIVVANCLPFYVEVASVKNKLNQILKNNHDTPNIEYSNTLQTSIEYLCRFYGYPKAKIEYMLTQRHYIPSLIKNLRNEVNVRLTDKSSIQLFENIRAEEQKREPRIIDEIELLNNFESDKYKLYCYDLDFAKSVKPIFTVHKSSKKASGQITEDTLRKVIENENGLMWVVRKDVMEVDSKKSSSIKKVDLANIYTNDKKLKEKLEIYFEGYEDKDTLGKILKEKGIDGLYTSDGKKIYKLSFIASAKNTLKKQIDENNYSNLPDSSYYCIEVYKDKDGNTNTTGIAFSDIIKKAGKLWLKEDYKYPENYASHIMYLFTNDYIKVFDKNGKIKFEGYYKSVKTIGRSNFYAKQHNNVCADIISIAKKDNVLKYAIDLLGDIGGKIKCGEQLSSVKGKE